MEQKNRAYVENMIQGDESAFDSLYHSYSGKLYRMAYFITGNRSDSEDILQETFVKCFLHRRDLKDPERFESWLYQILVRTAWRAGKKKKDFSLDGILDNEDDTGLAAAVSRDWSAGPLEQIVEQEDVSELWQAVQNLDVKYRTVVLLYYYNELGTKEIARITGTLEGTVKSRLFKARKLLRSQLEQNGLKEKETGERRMCHEQRLG